MDDFSGLKAGDLDGFEEYIKGTMKGVKEPKAPREVLFEDTSEDKDDTFDANDIFL